MTPTPFSLARPLRCGFLCLLALPTLFTSAFAASEGVGEEPTYGSSTTTLAGPLNGTQAQNVRPGEIIIELSAEAARVAPGTLAEGFAARGAAGGASLDALLASHGAKGFRRVFQSFEDGKGRLVDTTQARVGRARSRHLALGRSAGPDVPPDLPALENYFLVEVDAEGVSLDALIAELEQNEMVVAAQPNYVYGLLDEPLPAVSYIPNDPYISTDGQFWSQGAFGNTYPDLYGVRNTRALEAFSLMDGDGNGSFDPGEVAPGEGVVIAIVDTGIDPNHPDILVNVYTNPGEIPGDGIDNDGNGRIDDVSGWDFVSGDNDPYDGEGHGTHVSGTAGAAAGNAAGIVGMAPFVKIMPLKGLNDSGSGNSSGLAGAILYAAANGADVISNSWGGFVEDPILEDAFEVAAAAGALSIAAAGNDGQPRLSSPARIDTVFSVAAVNHTDKLASFSNRATDLDLCAPGVATLSLRAGTTGYVAYNGTSMATPHVAGAAATLMSMFPGDSAAEIRGRLLAGAANIDAVNPGLELELGAGRLDLYGSAVATPAPLIRITRVSATPLVGDLTVATIEVEVENAWQAAADVKARLLPVPPRNARVLSKQWSYGALASGERKVGTFEIRPNPQIEAGEPIELRLLLSTDSGPWEEFLLTLYADHFEDVTESTGWVPPSLVAAGAAFADYDGDGFTDFAMVSGFGPMALYHNEGDGTFVRSPVRSVVGVRPNFLDLDGDGDLDLVGTSGAGSELHANDGTGSFSRVNGTLIDASLLATGFTPIDLEGDGDLDLVTTRPSVFVPPGSDVYRSVNVLRNDGGLTFTEIWEDTGLPRNMYHWQMLTLDFDDDGLLDLFGAGFTGQGRLYRNNGDGTFQDVTGLFPNGLACDVQCEPVKTAAVGDYDNDGDLDLVTVGSNLQDPQNHVFHFYQYDADAGEFLDVTDETLTGHVAAMTGLSGTEFFDIDNDGDLDLMAPFDGILAGGGGAVVSPTNVVLENNGDGTFTPISDIVFPMDMPLASYVTSIADFDQDGRLDILGAGGTTIIETGGLLRNVAGQNNHWLEIDLVPTVSAPGAYGARVTVETFGGGKQLREVHYGPMDASTVHFGLGKRQIVKTITVRWPSGITQRLKFVRADQRIVIEEPAVQQ